jgi:hypothetical protein
MAAGALNLQPNVRDAGETRRPDLQRGHVCLLALNDAGALAGFPVPAAGPGLQARGPVANCPESPAHDATWIRRPKSCLNIWHIWTVHQLQVKDVFLTG